MPVTSCSSCGAPGDAVTPFCASCGAQRPPTSAPGLPAGSTAGGCPNCGSDAVRHVTTGAFGEFLKESGNAAAGCGTFLVGLVLLVFIPVLGAIVLGLALLLNLLVLVTVVAGAGVALRSRGALGCATCDHVWRPRRPAATDQPLMRPWFAWSAGSFFVGLALLVAWFAVFSPGA
jgi:hypothetical protein